MIYSSRLKRIFKTNFCLRLHILAYIMTNWAKKTSITPSYFHPDSRQYVKGDEKIGLKNFQMTKIRNSGARHNIWKFSSSTFSSPSCSLTEWNHRWKNFPKDILPSVLYTRCTQIWWEGVDIKKKTKKEAGVKRILENIHSEYKIYTIHETKVLRKTLYYCGMEDSW